MPTGFQFPQTFTKPYTIAEVGINHNGCLARACQMIDSAAHAGCDAVKFQTFQADRFVADPTATYTYQSQGQSVAEPMVSLFKRHEFSLTQWQQLARHCQQVGITFLSTAQDAQDLELLQGLGLPAIKIGSDDLTYLVQIKQYRHTGLPLILSCGMATDAEIDAAVHAAGYADGHSIVLLVCTSQYPTPLLQANVARVATLRQRYPNLVVGFSDHTQGSVAAVVATALGAMVFEKHFTLDTQLPGPDHWFSETPASLTQWVQDIHHAFEALGHGQCQPSPQEWDMRKTARRSVVALQDIAAGALLTPQNTGVKRPGHGLCASVLEHCWGQRAARPIQANELFTPDCFV